MAALAILAGLLPVDTAVADERERPNEREIVQTQMEIMKLAMPALREAERRDAVELLERAIHAREIALSGRQDDEAHQIRERAPSRGQLAEILRMASGLWKEFNNEEKAAVVGRLAAEFAGRGVRDREASARERREADERARPDRERAEGAERERPRSERPVPEIERRRRELEEQARHIQHALAELGNGREEGRALDLKAKLRQIHEQLRRLHAPRPEREAGERMRARLAELRRSHAEAMEAGQEEKAGAIRREIEAISREFLPRAERRPPMPGAPHIVRDVNELKAAVRQLQGEVRETRHQLNRIHDLLERLADRVMEEEHEDEDDEEDEDEEEDDDEEDDDEEDEDEDEDDDGEEDEE
jgi:hypothetical protein